MREILLLSPVRRRFLVQLPLLLILLLVAGLSAFVGGGLILKHPAEPGLEWLAVLSGIAILGMAVFFFWGMLEQLRDSQTQIVATEAGIERRVFGKVRQRILWADLMEVGIAMESWSGRGGPFYSLYFADCVLEPLQRAAHIEGEVKQGTEISVLCRDVETACLAELAAMCPLPLPILKADGPGADSDLLTYRRNRTTEASWGEAESDWLLDADSFRRRLWEERRKRTKKR